jgi:membrane associated rhomboid family serine protease
MNGYDPPEDQEPITWLSGYPIYAAHFIVLIFVASMLVTTGFSFFHHNDWLDGFTFAREQVLKGEVWRIFTYGLVNQPTLWFAVEMFLIARFGRELERVFGRRSFLRLYLCIYLLSPLLFMLIGVGYPVKLEGESGSFALFIAFATVYPDMPMLFNVLAKWLAMVLVGIYSLMSISRHDLVGLISLWATVGFAFAYVRYEQGRLTLPSISLPKRTPHLHALPDLKPKKLPVSKSPKESSMEEVDALLDKIAATGMSSLTPKERATLDRAREALLKKEPTQD